MQINGLGSEHNTDSHYVTSHVKHHGEVSRKLSGGMQNTVSNAATQQTRQVSAQESPQTEVNLLQRVLDKGRDLLKAIWGSSDGTASGSVMSNENATDSNATGTATMAGMAMELMSDNSSSTGGNGANLVAYDAMAGYGAVHGDRVAVETTVKTGVTGGNPYFTIAEAEQRPRGFLGEIRYKIKGIAGRLAGKLPGKMFQSMASDSFETGAKKQSGENLKRQSKYKKDQLEIDCVITDDSFLMDSYDQKVEYRQLSTK